MSDYDPDAERAARDWLALADRGDAEGSYAAAASTSGAPCRPMRDADGQWRVSGYVIR